MSTPKDRLKNKLDKVNEWALDYLVKREDAWKCIYVELLDSTATDDELELEELCYNADSFHTVWVKLESLKLEEAIEEFFPSKADSSSEATISYYYYEA